MLTSARPHIPSDGIGRVLVCANEIFDGERFEEAGHRGDKLRYFQRLARVTVSPVEHLEQFLHPWASFVIIPLFALANAGVVFSLQDIGNPVAIAVAAGSSIGKPLGMGLLFLLLPKSEAEDG